MFNQDVRDMLEKAEVTAFQIASELGIGEDVLMEWLKVPMSDSRKRQVREALMKIQTENK